MKDRLRIAGSSDWHINNHNYGFMDETGRSSSLLQYIDLAEDFLKFALKYKADVLVIAGDIVDQPVLKPMVADVLDCVIEILQAMPLIITHGQHDLDTKTESLANFHSALNIFSKHRGNLTYCREPGVVDLSGFRLCVAPWNAEYKIPNHEGDVFIGHGAVRSCVNADGYRFNSGFDPHELFRRFKLSIVGDVHNGQTFVDDVHNREILIPGSPIQLNFKDSPKTGFWICDVDKNGGAGCEFVSIESLRPNFYHKFLYTDDPGKRSSNLVHYRFKPSRSPASSRKTPEFKKDVSSIKELGLSIIKQAKINNKEVISEQFINLMETVSSSERKVPRSRLHSLEIHNFLSVEDFYLDFKEFPDNLVITGKNGHGKSSLVEAIYWVLTGATTKGIPVNSVKNWYGDSGTWVAITLEIEDTMYKIGRGRTDGPQLQIFMFTDKWVPYTGTKTSCTQDVIYELLSLSDNEIKLLSYFPAKEPYLFGSIGKSDRLSLLLIVVGMDTVDAAREKVANTVKENAVEIATSKARLSTLRSLRDNFKIELANYMAKRDAKAVSNVEQLKKSRASIELELKKMPSSSVLKQEITKRSSVVKSLEDEKHRLDRNMVNILHKSNEIAQAIIFKKNALSISLDGTCPTCSQPLCNDDVVNALTLEIENLKSQLPDPALSTVLQVDFQNKNTEQARVEREITDFKAKIDVIHSLESQLSSVDLELAKSMQADCTLMIDSLTVSYEKHEKEIVQEEVLLEALQGRQEAMDWIHKILLKRNGLLISALAKQGQKLVQEHVDLLTDDASFKVIIEDDLSISAVFLGRQPAEYNQLSTGQARVVDIVLMVALNNLFTQLYALEHGILGLVIFDEVLSFLDPAYSDFCYGLINRVNVPKRIVITHDRELIAKFSSEINAFLEGESSSVYSKSWS